MLALAKKIECPLCLKDHEEKEFRKDLRFRTGVKRVCRVCERRYKTPSDAGRAVAEAQCDQCSTLIDSDRLQCLLCNLLMCRRCAVEHAKEHRGGMYHRHDGKLDKIEEVLLTGVSDREVSRQTGAHRGTVRKARAVLEEIEGPILCKCGRSSNHRGFCSVRFEKSQPRQKFMRRWHPNAKQPFKLTEEMRQRELDYLEDRCQNHVRATFRLLLDQIEPAWRQEPDDGAVDGYFGIAVYMERIVDVDARRICPKGWDKNGLRIRRRLVKNRFIDPDGEPYVTDDDDYDSEVFWTLLMLTASGYCRRQIVDNRAFGRGTSIESLYKPTDRIEGAIKVRERRLKKCGE